MGSRQCKRQLTKVCPKEEEEENLGCKEVPRKNSIQPAMSPKEKARRVMTCLGGGPASSST